MVNSRARGTKDMNLRTGVDCINTPIVPIFYPTTSKHLVLAIYSSGTSGGVVALGSSLLFPRAAAGTRGRHSTLHHTGTSIVRYSMQGQQTGDAGEVQN